MLKWLKPVSWSKPFKLLQTMRIVLTKKKIQKILTLVSWLMYLQNKRLLRMKRMAKKRKLPLLMVGLMMHTTQSAVSHRLRIRPHLDLPDHVMILFQGMMRKKVLVTLELLKQLKTHRKNVCSFTRKPT